MCLSLSSIEIQINSLMQKQYKGKPRVHFQVASAPLVNLMYHRGLVWTESEYVLLWE